MKTRDIVNQLEPKVIGKMSGIYFLYQNDEIVYVGQSINLGERVYSHVADGTKQFNRCAVYEMPYASSIELNNMEAQCIVDLSPKYNNNIPANDYYKTINHVKKALRIRGIRVSNNFCLKKYIQKSNIIPACCFSGFDYYRISDFEGLR